jgi:hypothetical protein
MSARGVMRQSEEPGACRICKPLATYPANVCPIFCDGMASHSKPRTAILHNRDGHCKRFLSELGYPSREPTQTGLQRVSRVRMLERKEKMKAIHRTLHASSNRKTYIRIGRIKTTTRTCEHIRT